MDSTHRGTTQTIKLLLLCQLWPGCDYVAFPAFLYISVHISCPGGNYALSLHSSSGLLHSQNLVIIEWEMRFSSSCVWYSQIKEVEEFACGIMGNVRDQIKFIKCLSPAGLGHNSKGQAATKHDSRRLRWLLWCAQETVYLLEITQLGSILLAPTYIIYPPIATTGERQLPTNLCP